MDDNELLRAIYRAIVWEKFYRTAPDASRARVDELFSRLAETLKGEAAADLPHVSASVGPALEGGAPRQARLYCDGASSGNPGPAGIGMVLYAPDGAEIQAWGAPIGRATNNVAEYRALLEGLDRALELGVRRIEVFSDSELLVRQLTGRYKVRSPALAELHKRARALLDRFESWTARHIPRGQNGRANSIAVAQRKRVQKGR